MGGTPVAAKNVRIVTLCGSRDALTAYFRILRTVPPDSGMAFLVLTHRRPGSPCHLVKILSSITKMHVQQIENGSTLLPNRVYVIPPGMDLTTDGTVFHLVPMSKTYGWPNVFDIFLTSLAKNRKNEAVTIILSGTGRDGSRGLGDLKANGGNIAFAQSDAFSRGMPASAVATGHIDYFCSAEDIGTIVAALPSQPASLGPYTEQ